MTASNDGPADPLEAELAALPGLSLDELRLRWRRLTRRPAPPSLRREMLARFLAYELQVRAYGGLPREIARLLDRLAGDADPAEHLARRDERRPPSGTQFVREYDGKVHRVAVTDAGFLWNGSLHASLSPIAEAITGTRWNGPRFFGLREKASSRSEPPVQQDQSRKVSQQRRSQDAMP
ncbi:DUF2924 domain-containing protein [Methylobacterium brachythecii]|uniref:DUF2924 domain-containing protein n=1 Tax=Methylobacterium brachythecii TaxID=1176177 RepID=A0A7W6AG59_9HYPH|nr:DUF2924 domain-containing protein [Methylobacterium brachythecii]MBB3902723.1 hypothetical protein [Methylobacterium brachythecii]GLS42567.1 hypothetical protein GCM10007884_05520 [Methylobacterium brachythecii]